MTTIQMFFLGVSFGILLTLNILPESLNNKLLKLISYISFKSIFKLILFLIMLKAIQYAILNDQSISWYQLATSSDGVGDVGAIVKDNSVVIQNPHFSLSAPQKAWDAVVGAASVAAGASAGVKLAKQIPHPAGKLLAVGSVMMASKLIGGQARMLHEEISNSNPSKSKFVSFIVDNIDSITNTMPSVNDFPFKLLVNLPMMSTLQLFLLTLMFNSFIALFISSRNIDLSNYLPNNRLGGLIVKWSNRLVSYWAGSALFVYILSSITMFALIWTNKLSIVIVLSALN